MYDPISREAAIKAMECINDSICAQQAIDALCDLPTAEKVGKWIDTGSGQECSVCHEIQYGYDNHRHFCANCGADMRGEEDE